MTPANDPWVRLVFWGIRIGSSVALLLGLCMLFGLLPEAELLPWHILFGLAALLSSASLYARFKLQGYERTRQMGTVLLALAVGALNGPLATTGMSSGLLHVGIVALGYAAAEITFRRVMQ